MTPSVIAVRDVAAGGPQVRVFLVDDHEVVRRGVAEVLSADPATTVVGGAGTAAAALARIPALRPDVAVVDLRLPDGDGVSLCRELLARVPGLRVLVFTSYSDDEALLESVAAGASGYLLKDVLGADLVSAVRTVAAGGSTLDPRAVALVVERIAQGVPEDPLAELSEREREVFALIGQGLTNRQIGERLYIAEKTVKNYVSHLLAKLGLERRTQVAVMATQLRVPARAS